MKIYKFMPLEELVEFFIEMLLKHSTDRQDEFTAVETEKLARAIIARGDDGAAALRSLLGDSREEVQLLSAVWLSELDPYGAAPTLERLKREAQDPAVGSLAQLKLLNNRQRGLLPAN